MFYSKRVIFVFFLTVVYYCGFGQTSFYAVSGGNWNVSGVWSTDGVTPIICLPCVAGTDYPGPSDDAYTNGFSITIPPGNVANCRDLYVDDSTPSGINLLLPVSNLTINGTLYSYSAAFFFPFPPQVANLITGSGLIRFTGSNLGNALGALVNGDEVIIYWNSLAPLGRVTFELGSNSRSIGQIWLSDFSGLDNLRVTNSFIVNSGTLSFDEFSITDLRVNTTFTVASGATVNLPVPATQNGATSSRIGTANISGTLNMTTSTAYFNASTFNLNAGGSLNLFFDDPSTQTEGWWHTTNRPTIGSLNGSSTVTYASLGDQNVYARTYGNLTLDGGGDKTVPNTGALGIAGTLTINSPSINFSTVNATGITINGSLLNQGNWSPVQLITFGGTSDATIGGSQSTTFGGGITVNKATATLTMATATNINTNISNGITISTGTLSLGNVNTTLTGGNISNSGVLTSGASGTLRIQGTSQLSGAGSYTLTNLNVLGTGDATINSDMAITGNLINSGLLSFSNAIDVTFNGSGAQSISGNAFSIYDMIVNKVSTTLSNNGTINLLGTLMMTNGTLDADGSGGGSFVLTSNTGGDARIGPMGNGSSITGNVTFQRYFNNTVTNRYRNFSFPVSGVTVGTLGSFITIVPGSFAWYNETVFGNYDQGWVLQNSGPLLSGRAYTAGMYTAAPITFSFTGPLHINVPTTAVSPYNYGLTYTNDPAQPASQDGWNFVPNPYASPIDWNSGSGWTKGSGLDAAAAVWDEVGGAYRYSNASWDGVVAQGQSFWVHATSASTTLLSTENVKAAVADPTFYRKRTIVPEDRLVVRLENDKSEYDVAVIEYRELATAGYDGAFDAYKLPNQIFNLSSLTPEGEDLAVNALPKSFCTNRLKLNITNIIPGSYDMSFESVTSFNSLDSLVLYDKFLEKSTRINEGSVYGFEVTTDAASYGADRFELQFTFPQSAPISPEVSLDNRKLVSNFESGNQWLLNGEIIPSEEENYLLPMVAGDYQVVVSDGICTVKSQVYTLDRVPSRIHPNPASTYFDVDLTDVLEADKNNYGQIHLYSVTGQTILSESFGKSEHNRSVKLDGVKPGTYIVNIIVGDSKIVAKERLMVK